MSGKIQRVTVAHLESIKKYECPDCGTMLEQAAAPGKAKDGGPYTHWDFICINEKCHRVWRVSRALYEEAFGFWPE